MCFGAPDTSVQQEQLAEQQKIANQAQKKADAEQAATQATVKADQGTVNSAFDQFNPDYFSKYRDAYTGYYTPQVQDQYQQAQDQLTAALTGNGTLESTVGANALANLAKRNTDQTAQIQGQADNAVNALKQNVSGQKTALYNEANSAVDPTQIASSAQAQTTALAAPQTYTPLANIFSDLVTPFSNYTKSAANAPVQGVTIPQPVTASAYGTGNGQPQNPYATG